MRPITYVATGRLSAAMEQVFHTLTDPAQVPSWLPGCQAVVTDGPVEKGSRVRAQFGKRVTEFEVVDYAPPHRFGWTERGWRQGWKLWFRLDAADRATAVTVCEVWAPRSFRTWLLARLFPRRNSQLYVEQIFERLQRRFP